MKSFEFGQMERPVSPVIVRSIRQLGEYVEAIGRGAGRALDEKVRSSSEQLLAEQPRRQIARAHALLSRSLAQRLSDIALEFDLINPIAKPRVNFNFLPSVRVIPLCRAYPKTPRRLRRCRSSSESDQLFFRPL